MHAAPVRKQPRRSLPLQERTGADSPHGITHGITLRGAQLTHAILLGHKKVENRHFAMKPGWYALHTGAKASAHESQHALLAAITPQLPDEMALPHSSIVGAIRISHALTLEQCACRAVGLWSGRQCHRPVHYAREADTSQRCALRMAGR